jgi:hypothetical protein
MGIEKRFVADGVRSARVENFLTKELKRAGYGGMEIVRTPLGTQITIYAGLTVALNAAEESPHTNRTRSRMQVWVARVTALTQKRHALPLAMMRPSHRL